MEKQRKDRLYLIAVVLLLACLLSARPWRAIPADALDQPAGDPGTAADPVLSANSLRQHLGQLFEAQSQQLDSLQARLDLASQGLQGLQGIQGMPAASFPDMHGHWAESAVLTLKTRGIISGFPDGNFHPEDPVTRAAMAVMLASAKNLTPDPGAAGFPDAPSSYWAVGAIGAAKAAGYLQGYPDGSFRPGQGVNRAEAAVLLDKAFSPQNSGRPVSFADVGSSYWAADAIGRLASAGIVSGYPDSTFHPNKVINRAEASVLLARVLPSQ